MDLSDYDFIQDVKEQIADHVHIEVADLDHAYLVLSEAIGLMAMHGITQDRLAVLNQATIVTTILAKMLATRGWHMDHIIGQIAIPDGPPGDVVLFLVTFRELIRHLGVSASKQPSNEWDWHLYRMAECCRVMTDGIVRGVMQWGK